MGRLDFLTVRADIGLMENASKTATATRRKVSSKFIGAGTYGKGYLGVTKDGVKILRPERSPTNFTVEEVRAAVAKALSKSA